MSICKVSVCIPTYNYGNYIAETIESVLAQNFSDFELLIIDDCSKDQTADVVESYARKDPRIRFIVNKVNLGMVENWNSCIAQARGEYIKFVFGDDLLASPDAVGRMVSLLDNNITVSLACSARNLIDESSHVTEIESHFDSGIMTGTDVINLCLADQGNLIGEPSVVMFRKSQARRGFNSNYMQIVDLEMWFHLLEQGSFAFVNEPLCSFRIHGKQQTAVNAENFSLLKDVYFLQCDYLNKDYVNLSGFMKAYLEFDSLYGIWKLYKKRRISRETAIELINRNRSFSFTIWYPFYKLFKPLYKQYSKMAKKTYRLWPRLSPDPIVAGKCINGNSVSNDNFETTALLAQNRNYFNSAAHAALSAGRAELIEPAMVWAKRAADCAGLMHPGFYTYPPLEAMLRTLGDNLAKTPAVDAPSLPIRKGAAKTWLHLISTAYMIGGHTRLVERLIVNASAGNEDQHSIILIDQGKQPFPSWLSDAAESSGGTLIKLPVELSLVERARVVRRSALEWADGVVLHVHPNDTVASVAFAPSGGPPVVYVNHADHVFWLGSGCPDIVADIRPEGRDLTISRRGDLQSMIVPIPLELPGPVVPAAEARRFLGIAANAVVLLTIASGYKFAPYRELDFPANAAKILQNHTDAILLVVGPEATDPHWQNALELTGGRIRLLGIQAEIEQYYAAADICLESFPIGSLTSTLDAMLRGVPVIRAPRRTLPILKMSDYNGLGDAPADTQEYLFRASALITDPSLRKEAGEAQRQAVTDIHTGIGWLEAWQRLVAHIPVSHGQRPEVNWHCWDTLTDLDLAWSELLNRQFVAKSDKDSFFKKRIRAAHRKRSRGAILCMFLTAVLQGNWNGARILLRNITQQ